MTLVTRDHVCLSSIDWGYLWQGPQEIMTRFARGGSRVLYIEHMGVRRPYFADSGRVLGRLRDWTAHPAGRPGPQGAITIVSPVVLPFPWLRPAQWLNRVIFADRLPARARAMGLARPVVWTFVPTPIAVDAVRAFGRSRGCAVYYCVADFAAVTDDPAAMRRSEDSLLGEVDVVFVGGRVLEKRFTGRHGRVVLAPFSVADNFFLDRRTEPADMASIPRPRVGYVGGLHRHVDQALLERTVALLPDVHFVFVGPKVSGDWPLERVPNAHFLGRREHADLPAYVDAFDIGFVPYGITPFTETVWPTKLHEYLARGKAVVSTPLPEVKLLGYDERAVRMGAAPEELRDAIRASLADATSWRDERQALAREYSWARTVKRMSDEIGRVATSRR